LWWSFSSSWGRGWLNYIQWNWPPSLMLSSPINSFFEWALLIVDPVLCHSSSSWLIGNSFIHKSCLHMSCSISSEFISTSPKLVLEFIIFLQGLVQQRYTSIYNSLLWFKSQPRHHV
jgi:hypothetical protein